MSRISWVLAIVAAGVVSACGGGDRSPTGPGNPPPDSFPDISDTTDWSTFLGGSGQDIIRDIATDAQGNIYIAGGTESHDWPTTAGAYDRTHDNSSNGSARPYDVFVAKLSRSGRLIWSTLVGGPGYDRAYALELDPQGNVVIAGRAGAGFPVTPGVVQSSFAGGPVSSAYGSQDGFVCKLRPDGSDLVFCTYFGTPDDAIIRDVDVDAAGAVYLATSVSNASTLPSGWFSGSYQPTKAAGIDGLLAKLGADGSTIEWATFIGGGQDEGRTPSVRVDGNGAVWYLTNTESGNMPLANAFQTANAGGRDYWLGKFSGDGTQLLAGSYLGGSGQESMETHNLAVSRLTGDAYVGGQVSSSNMPTTQGAYRPSFGGATDGYVARVSSTGRLLAATYLGTAADDYIQGVAVGPSGQVLVGGGSSSASFPHTAPVWGTPAGWDVFGVVLSADLGQLLSGVYAGGGDSDEGRSLGVMNDGSLLVGGVTQSSNWPIKYPWQAQHGGGSWDAALLRFKP